MAVVKNAKEPRVNQEMPVFDTKWFYSLRPMLVLAVLAQVSPVLAADPSGGTSLSVKTYSAYRATRKPGWADWQEFRLFESLPDFKRSYEAASNVLEESQCVPEDTFQTNVVLALLKWGDTPCEYQVDQVVARDAILEVRYQTKIARKSKGSRKEHVVISPLIVPLPKAGIKAIHLVENGRSRRMLSLEEAVYQTPLGELGVTLTADQPVVMLGEPIFLSFTVHNHSERDLQALQMNCHNSLGRPNNFSFMVRDRERRGLPLPRVDAGPTLGGNIGPHTIPAREDWVYRHFLPHWVNFTTVGQYTITCKTVLEIFPVTGPDGKRWDWQREPAIKVPVEVTTCLRVVPKDEVQMGTLIEALGQAMLTQGRDSRDARESLGWIDDERVIPWFSKALATRSYEMKFAALKAFSKFNNDRAFAGLKRGMENRGKDLPSNSTNPDLAEGLAENIRVAAQWGFIRSPHPGARKVLLSLVDHPDTAVRLSVIRTLDYLSDEESLAVLRKMCEDSDEEVQKAALRCVKQREKEQKKKGANGIPQHSNGDSVR